MQYFFAIRPFAFRRYDALRILRLYLIGRRRASEGLILIAALVDTDPVYIHSPSAIRKRCHAINMVDSREVASDSQVGNQEVWFTEHQLPIIICILIGFQISMEIRCLDVIHIHVDRGGSPYHRYDMEGILQRICPGSFLSVTPVGVPISAYVHCAVEETVLGALGERILPICQNAGQRPLAVRGNLIRASMRPKV